MKTHSPWENSGHFSTCIGSWTQRPGDKLQLSSCQIMEVLVSPSPDLDDSYVPSLWNLHYHLSRRKIRTEEEYGLDWEDRHYSLSYKPWIRTFLWSLPSEKGDLKSSSVIEKWKRFSLAYMCNVWEMSIQGSLTSVVPVVEIAQCTYPQESFSLAFFSLSSSYWLSLLTLTSLLPFH
jgi:hypothetical protein